MKMTESLAQISILFWSSTFLRCRHMAPAPQWLSPVDSILEDKELMKMHVDLQKRFPIYHVYPKCMAALLCGAAIRMKALNIPSGIGCAGE